MFKAIDQFKGQKADAVIAAGRMTFDWTVDSGGTEV